MLAKPQRASDFLPMEMWGKIFDHLFKSSPWDLVSCSKVCREWSDLLESRHSAYLMAGVIYLIPKLLDPQEILKCRLVCHSWNIAINDFISSSEDHIDYTINFENSSASITKITSIMASTSVPSGGSINPFFGRKITVTNFIGNRRYNRGFQTAFKSLLARFGSEIWCFEFMQVHRRIARNPIRDDQPLLTYKLLRSYLEYLPNLKKLMVGGYILRDHNSDPRTMACVDRLLREEPFPKLENLTHLTMYHPNDLLAKGILLQYGNQIKELDFSLGGHSLAQFLEFMAPIQMDKLTDLWITPVEKEEDILALSMSSLKWPLKYLVLVYISDTVQLEMVLQVVSQFGDTLKELFITVGGDGDSDDDEDLEVTAMTPTQVYRNKDIKLNLPNLTYLNIEGKSLCFETIDFLLPCGALQGLRLGMMAPSPTPTTTLGERFRMGLGKYTFGCFGFRDENVIKFKGNKFACTSMYKSNIWEVLPELSYLRCSVSSFEGGNNGNGNPNNNPGLMVKQLKVYTRNGYESFKRK
ncbi:unnamed protein product [Orchesella dallaii]|uniref:F-box domain-containing protein n=1 Tax=Orchesella dallaii TaxID=48710 RepID=A0ABP1RZ01_9HEXA